MTKFAEREKGEVVRRILLPRTRANNGRGSSDQQTTFRGSYRRVHRSHSPFGEGGQMYWYNPATCMSERVAAPSCDMQAIEMLADSAEFVKEYCELRRSGTPIEQALVLVGHDFRMRQPEYQLALR